jgi:MFS family permease
MVGGMLIGAVGFALLAVSQNPWVFIAGIAVFSVGEMTAHPKYYSFIGLIAPADRKAVYMGYSFLYGVFGSLIGANLGTLFYESYLQPAMGTPAAAGRSFWFWMTFAILDTVAAAGLFAVGRRFGTDTPETRRGARRVMVGVYLVLTVLGLAVLGYDVWAHMSWSAPLNYKTAVQALLFIALGSGGIAILRRGPRRLEGTPQ